MNEPDFTFATSDEIAIELASRAKELRVNIIKMNQKEFAKKIGLSYGKYQRFEQSGDIKLSDFILVVTHLNRLAEITKLLKAPDLSDLGIVQARKGQKKRLRAGWNK